MSPERRWRVYVAFDPEGSSLPVELVLATTPGQAKMAYMRAWGRSMWETGIASYTDLRVRLAVTL